jgi:hypothetical protein
MIRRTFLAMLAPLFGVAIAKAVPAPPHAGPWIRYKDRRPTRGGWYMVFSEPRNPKQPRSDGIGIGIGGYILDDGGYCKGWWKIGDTRHDFARGVQTQGDPEYWCPIQLSPPEVKS